MSTTSSTHLVLIPSYNTGAALCPTVRAAREQWTPVWVVIDGSRETQAGRAVASQRNWCDAYSCVHTIKLNGESMRKPKKT